MKQKIIYPIITVVLLAFSGCKKEVHPFLGEVANLMEDYDCSKEKLSETFAIEMKKALDDVIGNEITITGNPYGIKVSKGRIFRTTFNGEYPILMIELIPDEDYDFDFSGFGPGSFHKRIHGLLHTRDEVIGAPYAWSNIGRDFRVVINLEIHHNGAEKLNGLEYIELVKE